jgi:hypothetical protein
MQTPEKAISSKREIIKFPNLLKDSKMLTLSESHLVNNSAMIIKIKLDIAAIKVSRYSAYIVVSKTATKKI